MQIETLNRQAHGKLKIDTEGVAALGARERMVPVVLDEFQKLIVHYPLVLTKSAETGQFLCAALLGFEQDENLFWNNDRWDGIYTPLNISRQPFFLGKDSEQGLLICLDTQSPCITQDAVKGESLFDEQGGETQFLHNMRQMLANLVESEKRTRQFIETLVKFELIVPLSLNITFASDEARQVKGIYSVDEDKLLALPTAARDELFNHGYLKSIYIMIASLAHIYSLIQRKNQRIAEKLR